MNEQVAWMYERPNGSAKLTFVREPMAGTVITEIPLYTHPAKHLSLQKVDGELVAVTYTDDEHRIIEVLWEKPPAKTLTDEEIQQAIDGIDWNQSNVLIRFAKAILRKAQEK